jgi:hypothetical protein
MPLTFCLMNKISKTSFTNSFHQKVQIQKKIVQIRNTGPLEICHLSSINCPRVKKKKIWIAKYAIEMVPVCLFIYIYVTERVGTDNTFSSLSILEWSKLLISYL